MAVMALEYQDPTFNQKQQLEQEVVNGLIARMWVKNDLDKLNMTKMKLEMIQGQRDAVIAPHRVDEYNKRVNNLLYKLLEDDSGDDAVIDGHSSNE